MELGFFFSSELEILICILVFNKNTRMSDSESSVLGTCRTQKRPLKFCSFFKNLFSQ